MIVSKIKSCVSQLLFRVYFLCDESCGFCDVYNFRTAKYDHVLFVRTNFFAPSRVLQISKMLCFFIISKETLCPKHTRQTNEDSFSVRLRTFWQSINSIPRIRYSKHSLGLLCSTLRIILHADHTCQQVSDDCWWYFSDDLLSLDSFTKFWGWTFQLKSGIIRSNI